MNAEWDEDEMELLDKLFEELDKLKERGIYPVFSDKGICWLETKVAQHSDNWNKWVSENIEIK